jgi:diguanylate cyclase (GGDEF)-like protein
MKKQTKGEVAGAALSGIVSSFEDINIIPEDQLPFKFNSIEPTAWYPYSYLIDTINLIEKSMPHSSSLLFWAGVEFIHIWYKHVPDKHKPRSALEWFYTNEKSGGYNTVVRGGTPDEIGWCKILTMDEAAGKVIFESVTPYGGKFEEGIIYGGCLLTNDMAYFSVKSEDETYDKNANFKRTLITVHFRPKSEANIESKFESSDFNALDKLTWKQTEDLLWCYRRLVEQNKLQKEYRMDITRTLKNAFEELHKVAAELRLANKKIEKMAITDMLSGLHNRRYFEQQFKKQWFSSLRREEKICILMLDIDYFKQYNDTYGHLAGDSVIRSVCKILQETFQRAEDIVARFGGEEFVVVTFGNNIEHINKLVEQLRKKLKLKKIEHKKSEVSCHITISIGSACAFPSRSLSPDDLIEQADKALYSAKNAGKDRHVHYE